MGDYKPYPAYKDSGIAWLGEIPAHWGLRRLKFVAAINTDTLPETTPKDFPIRYVDIGNVSSEGQVTDIQEYTFGDAPTRARRKVKVGDTIISTVRTYLRAIAYIDLKLSNHIVSTGFAVLRPRKFVFPKFLYYLVRSQGFVDAVMAHSTGVSYPAINPTTLAGLWGLLPPLPEQRAIAAFLDRETARIDTLIARKRELIDLLRRQRTALISHAVTKGLDPSVPLKDSGIEWLGEIPAHWDVRRLKFVGRIYNGATPKSTVPEYWGGDIRWVTPDDLGQLDGMYIADTKRKITLDGYISCGATLVPPESIIISTRAPIGHLAIARTNVCTNQGCRSIVPNRQIESMFLYFSLYASKSALQVLGAGSTFRELSTRDLRDFRIAVPPLPEQRAIAAYLDRETARIDRLIDKIEESIDLLQRQRTALISAAVTGKIDVREQT